MKIIIAGSRGITDYRHVEAAIVGAAFDITEVVSGNAIGVDILGEQWVGRQSGSIGLKIFKPNWNQHGRSAGIIRNKEMGDYADGLIAVWDGKSRGTKHMIEYMQGLGKPVYTLVVRK